MEIMEKEKLLQCLDEVRNIVELNQPQEVTKTIVAVSKNGRTIFEQEMTATEQEIKCYADGLYKGLAMRFNNVKVVIKDE